MPSTIPTAPPMAAAPRIGLLASVPPENNIEARWMVPEAIISYSPEGCVQGETVDMCDPVTFEETDRPDNVSWHSYGITVSDRCSTFGMDVDERKARVTRLLNMDTERQLGAELWDGAVTQAASMPVSGDPWPNTWLTNEDDFDNLSSSGPVGFVHALACLEQYLASNNGGQQGAIHATAQTVTHWESFRLLRREGNRILTMKDTVVIPSPGYSGNGPDGPAADNDVWAYATDMPRIFLGPPDISDVMRSTDRRNNTVLVVGTRPALVEWQRCRHAGIQLAQSVCDIGGAS